MTVIRCACLVAQQGENLLLVRVRQNDHWCLPRGKIEEGESPEQALERELLEELGIAVDTRSVRYLYTVCGPAYGHPGKEVQLACFSAQWSNSPRPLGEITEVRWLPRQARASFAPAVEILCSKFLSCG
jgi:8-oxo-dGTP pyrophosphatase MutT (NUDIX family)